MMRLTFFQSLRNDMGMRTGIDVEDETVWMHFKPGSGIDPSLLWYVNVEIAGKSLPTEPETVRQLFLDHAAEIQMAPLTELKNNWKQHVERLELVAPAEATS